MTLLDWMLVSAGHREAYGKRGAGKDAPDMETHKRLMERYGR